MNYGIINEEQLRKIDRSIDEHLINIGVECVILIDMAGNIITHRSSAKSQIDIYSLAALAAGNFATVDAMAKLIGENEFSLLFHKGEKSNIHFARVNNDLLMVSMFTEGLSLGFLRLSVSDTISDISRAWSE